MPRRSITTDGFEDQLDQILGVDRGPNGEPSSHDFLSDVATDLTDTIPERWDDLPVDPTNGFRMLISVAPTLGYPYVVWCRERDAETIELVEIEIDLGYSFGTD